MTGSLFDFPAGVRELLACLTGRWNGLVGWTTLQAREELSSMKTEQHVAWVYLASLQYFEKECFKNTEKFQY